MTPVAVLLAAALTLAASGVSAQTAPVAGGVASQNGTAAQAQAFVTSAEAELDRMSVYANHAQWLQATYINADSNFIAAKASAEANELAVRLAKQAARFNGLRVDPVTRRKLDLIKRGVVLPAASRPGAAQELSDIQSRLTSIYATGKFTHKGKAMDLDDLSDVLRTSRDPAELRAVWEGWRRVSPPMRTDYTRLVQVSGEGAKELGYADAGALWRSWYDMEPDAFAAETDRLWAQVKPLYQNLHCYVRAKLNETYGDAVQAKSGPIRADLLGNMWAQEWGNIYDVVAPPTAARGKAGSLGYDLTERLTAKGYDPIRMVKTGESFYTSMGFPALPQTFWERSQITRPRDREVVCHASAWNLDGRDDLRIKMCTRVNSDDFFTVHHELGHNVYQRAPVSLAVAVGRLASGRRHDGAALSPRRLGGG